jgi:D-sedoheptulose 7-phosphate isomerase
MTDVNTYIEEVSAVLRALPSEPIAQVVEVLARARREGRQVFVMGNGGSAATASHFCCDLSKGTIAPDKPRFKVIGLADNMALFSALANDWGYERVFDAQLEALAQPGDVAIGFSGSGNSLNVLRAMELARDMGLTTIGFSGFAGGKLAGLVDVCVVVPCDCMEQIEDVHLVLEHAICTALRSR